MSCHGVRGYTGTVRTCTKNAGPQSSQAGAAVVSCHGVRGYTGTVRTCTKNAFGPCSSKVRDACARVSHVRGGGFRELPLRLQAISLRTVLTRAFGSPFGGSGGPPGCFKFPRRWCGSWVLHAVPSIARTPGMEDHLRLPPSPHRLAPLDSNHTVRGSCSRQQWYAIAPCKWRRLWGRRGRRAQCSYAGEELQI